MTSELDGAAQLHASIDDACTALVKLPTATAHTAQIIAARAAALAPRRTGRLAASGMASTKDGRAMVEFGAVYAGPIHWGWPARHIRAQPFAVRAAERTEAEWTQFYETEVSDIIDDIHGI